MQWKKTHSFLLCFRVRKSSQLQALLHLQSELCISEHISCHHNAIHKLRKIFSNLRRSQCTLKINKEPGLNLMHVHDKAKTSKPTKKGCKAWQTQAHTVVTVTAKNWGGSVPIIFVTVWRIASTTFHGITRRKFSSSYILWLQQIDEIQENKFWIWPKHALSIWNSNKTYLHHCIYHELPKSSV